MDIKVEKVKQYNSTYKNILMVDGIPICIVVGDKKRVNVFGILVDIMLILMMERLRRYWINIEKLQQISTMNKSRISSGNWRK